MTPTFSWNLEKITIGISSQIREKFASVHPVKIYVFFTNFWKYNTTYFDTYHF